MRKDAILLALPSGSRNGTRTKRSINMAKNENPDRARPICNFFIPANLQTPTDTGLQGAGAPTAAKGYLPLNLALEIAAFGAGVGVTALALTVFFAVIPEIVCLISVAVGYLSEVPLSIAVILH